MSSLMAFLVTLGILNVSDTQDQAEFFEQPFVVEQTVGNDRQRDLRRERIELTNAWLRQLRQVPPEPDIPQESVQAERMVVAGVE